MSDMENGLKDESPSRGGSIINDNGGNDETDRYSHSKGRSRSGSLSGSGEHKKTYSRSRSRSGSRGRKSHRSSRYRSRSRSSKRYKSHHSYSRSRSKSYSPSYRSSRRSRSRSRSPASSRRRHQGNRENPQPGRCLGVFGLSIYTTENQLLHIFGKFGPVEKVQVIIDAKSGRSRGFCFVYFENHEDAKAAKEQCTGMEIDGRQIRVDYSITLRAHTPTPGIYMGRPTYMDERKWRNNRYNDDYHYGGSSRYNSYKRSPSPYYKSRKRYRSRSNSYSPRRY